MSAAPAPSSTRLLQVDGLRAVAALSVLLFHYTTRYEEVFLHSLPLGWGFAKGYLGVNLFFVISGFVIFMTIEAAKSPADFVFSRLTRLFPTFWAAVLLTWLLTLAVPLPGNTRSVKEMLANLTMLHEGFGVRSVDGAYWSLEVELVYYLWMLVLGSTGALAFPRRAVAIWVGLAAAVALAGVAGVRAPSLAMHYGLLQWVPWFALGMLGYLGWRHPGHRTGNLVCAALALVAVGVTDGFFVLATAVAAYAAVTLAARGKFTAMGWRPLTFVGGISYPLYLVHEQLGWLLMLKMQTAGAAPWVSVVAAMLVSVVAAWLLSLLVEKPAMARTRAWWKARRSGLQARETPGRKVYAAMALATLILLAVGSRVSARLRLEPAPRFDPIAKLHGAETLADCSIGPRTVVLLVLGQSNAASHAQAFRASAPITVFREGRCVRAADPLPGTSGRGASLWTALVPKLEAAHPGWSFILAPLAVGNTRAAQWTQPGAVRDLFDVHLQTMRTAGLKPDVILWQQGEADTIEGTEAKHYQQALTRLREQLDLASFTAPIVAARSSYCFGGGARTVDRVLDRLQSGGLPERVQVGPDIDQIDNTRRFDGCHFNAEGRKQAASLWFESLAPVLVGVKAGR
jgi:peptidoglycan/LPS O-acetylase OafA/YrhL